MSNFDIFRSICDFLFNTAIIFFASKMRKICGSVSYHENMLARNRKVHGIQVNSAIPSDTFSFPILNRFHYDKIIISFLDQGNGASSVYLTQPQTHLLKS